MLDRGLGTGLVSGLASALDRGLGTGLGIGLASVLDRGLGTGGPADWPAVGQCPDLT